MTLLKDNDYKAINIALLSLEADVKKLSKNTNFDAQLAAINKRIDEINTGDDVSAEIKNIKNDIKAIDSDIDDINTEIAGINTEITTVNTEISGIEQKLASIFSAENKITDFNTTTNPGIYYWETDAANKPSDYGVLLVNKYDGGDSASNLWVNQIAYGTNNKIYFRQNINSGNWTEWADIITSNNIGSQTVGYAKNMHSQTLDLSSLDKTKFYPVVCYTGYNFAEVAICSEGGVAAAEYNQNRIHFDISTQGWSDLPPTLNIREYACYQNNEVTIGCIGRGVHIGAWAIWLRGGLHYTCFSRDADLSLHTSDYTYGDETYTVGTNYYGGSNSNVNIEFTPQSTITEGAYSTRSITAPRIKANNKMVIPIGAASSLENGCIWIG